MRSGRVRGLRPLAVGAAAVLLVAACARGSGAGGGGQAGGSTGPSTSAPAPPTSAAGANVIVRGTVRPGVEPGCLLLDAQDKRAYLLLDADPSTVKPGTRVEIVGQRVDQVVSYCGEGVVLSVVSVRPLR